MWGKNRILQTESRIEAKSQGRQYIRISIQFNSIQFFIIYVPSQQPQGQLQAQHSVDTGNYIMDKHNIKSKTS
jgi:hypothetical protein